MDSYILYIWLGLVVFFMILEAMTPSTLISIWLAGGSLVALVAGFLKADFWLQLLLFIVVSGVLLCFTRPLALKYINQKRQPTNSDRFLDKTAIVTESIDNLSAVGQVKVGGQVWTARASDDSKIPTGTNVVIDRIEGVKLIVSQLNK